MQNRVLATWLLGVSCVAPAGAYARTVYRCVLDGNVSLSTAPEPGSRCEPRELDDSAAKVPNLWGSIGTYEGKLYRREQDGRTVYGTRALPGSVEVLPFTVKTPPAEPAHLGMGTIGPPRLDRYPAQFKAAAKAAGVDDAWLRAIAHAESYFDARAVSSKGAKGVMQLMPGTAREMGVSDPFSAQQSIQGGARYLKTLINLYEGDRRRAAAAYNAGAGTVSRYGCVPPYAETRAYLAKVEVWYERYRDALAR